jgi:hypothetical protein
MQRAWVQMFRTCFALALAASAGTVSAATPAESAQTPAAFWNFPPVLVNARGQPVTSVAAWKRTRAALRQTWQTVLGPLPRRKAPLSPQTLDTEHCDGFTREHVRYQVEEGIWTDGYLLTPNAHARRRAAVVVFHPTTPSHARAMVGLDPDYPEEKRQGLHLVARGFVVWCPRNYIFDEGADWAGNARRVLERHPEWTGMTRMLWDAVRAADFVASLPGVDRRRIGCLGHSLGAKQVLYAMAFDERYRAGVFSEGGIGLRFSNWDAPWYLGARVPTPDSGLDHHQLLAVIAPRAFLLMAGGSADHAGSRACLEAARPVYQLLGATENLEWAEHNAGHRYPPEARAVAEAFLQRHLGP